MDHLYFDNVPLRAALTLRSFGRGTFENLSGSTHEKILASQTPLQHFISGPKVPPDLRKVVSEVSSWRAFFERLSDDFDQFLLFNQWVFCIKSDGFRTARTHLVNIQTNLGLNTELVSILCKNLKKCLKSRFACVRYWLAPTPRQKNTLFGSLGGSWVLRL